MGQGRAELAVVVGASGAMGQVIAASLIEAGLGVLAVGRNEAPLRALAERLGPALVPCPADMTSDESIATLRRAADRTVRMVVSAPGVTPAGGVLTAPTAAVVDAVNVKVGGMLRLVRGVDERLVRGSRLVAVGGHYGYEPTAYAATAGVANAALANLVRQLCLGYGERGVTAHLLAPGPADTERLRKVAKDRAAKAGQTLDEALDEMRAESAIGALTTTAQVAWAVRMLLAPEADALTGSSLMMDAGRRHGLP